MQRYNQIRGNYHKKLLQKYAHTDSFEKKNFITLCMFYKIKLINDM